MPLPNVSLKNGLSVYRRNNIGNYAEAIKKSNPEMAENMTTEELFEFSDLCSQRIPREHISDKEFISSLRRQIEKILD